MSGYSQTYSGRGIDLLDPQPLDIDITDMAVALSRINRFCGQTSRPYSVAEHTILVAMLAPSEYYREAVCHDLTEAYLADIPGQIKAHCPGYVGIEARLHKVICEYLGVPVEIPNAVHLADKQALLVELEAFCKPLADKQALLVELEAFCKPLATRPFTVYKHECHDMHVQRLQCAVPTENQLIHVLVGMLQRL